MKTLPELFDAWADESEFAREAGAEMPTFPEFVRIMLRKALADDALDEAIRDAVALNEALPPVEQHITEEELWRAAEQPADAYVRPAPAATARPGRETASRRRPRTVRPRERHSSARRLTRAGPSDDPDLPSWARIVALAASWWEARR